jgi:hypothetical protein
MLALRARLRQAVVGQARATQREVLRVMEEARQRRQTGAVTAWTPPAMATDELLREVKWRLDVASVAELDAAAEVLERAARAAARRPDRGAPPARGTRPPGPGRR